MEGPLDRSALRLMGAALAAAGLQLAALAPDAGPLWGAVALVPLMAAAWLEAGVASAGGTSAGGTPSGGAEPVPFSARRVLAVGALYGFVLTVGSTYWAIPLFPRVYGFGLAKTLLVAAASTAFATLGHLVFYAALVRAARLGWAPSLTAGPLLVCLELLYPRMPPAYLGASLVSATAWVQMADLGGPLLLTLWLGAVNGLVFELGRALVGRRLPGWRGLAVALVVLLPPPAYGLHRARSLERELANAPRLRVGLVQPDRPVRVRPEDVAPIYAALAAGTRAVVARGPLDLVLWPEGAPPELVSPDLATMAPWVPEGWGDGALLFGATTDGARDPRGLRATSAFLVDAEGEVVGRYDKNALFPFGEYVPFGDRFPWLYDVLHVREVRRGTTSPVLALGAMRLGVLICYEDLLPAFVRTRVAPGDPGLFVNLTNDGWFFETPGAAIHMRLSRLRAVEHHRFLVRATNHGVSVVVDPLGRVVAEAPSFEPATLVADVVPRSGATLYARTGDWPGWGAVLGLPWLLLMRRRRAQRP